jgi:hypothetical protein
MSAIHASRARSGQSSNTCAEVLCCAKGADDHLQFGSRWVYRPDTYRMRASIGELIAAIDALG